MNMEDEAEAFLQEVDWVSKEVQGILSGKIDISESVRKEKQKKEVEDFRIREKENKQQAFIESKKKGYEGKGIKFDRFSSYCKYCSREFELLTPNCTICSRETQTSESRKIELMAKVEVYKKEKSSRDDNKHRWENWKKTEAMLYKKNSTNYKKWEFFVDETEEETQPEFIPPEGDPNFAALEKDIKDRAERRANDLRSANELKDRGNEFYKQGMYRNAIQKYEEALGFRKDLMVLYTNCAAAKLKIEEFEGAIKDCTRVIEYFEVFDKELESNKDTVFKAFYRRGDAHRSLKSYSLSVFDYEKALELQSNPLVETLLERAREEAAANNDIPELIGEINSSEEIISNLTTSEKINQFRLSGGYTILFKRLYESKDNEALKVLEFLMKDEEKFIQLQPLTLPLYDKRQTAAVIVLESVKKYKEDPEFCKRIIRVLVVSIENKHVREEIAKHSATTKGKKFYKQILELFCTCSGLIKDLAPILANLCLTTSKTALERKPCPGNMKSLIRYDWALFKDHFIELLLINQTEALGLLCNICSDGKLKKLVIAEKQIIEKGVDICKNSSSSLDVERAVGFLINILVQPTDLSLVESFWDSIWEANIRLFSIDTYIQEIEERGYKLMFRILVNKPEFIEKLSINQKIVKYLTGKIKSVHVDSIAKILAAVCSNLAFVNAFDINMLADALFENVNMLNRGDKVDDRVGNLCLAAGRTASCKSESSIVFKKCIPGLVKVAKEKLGPVRKNVAICLGKISNCEENKEVLRSEHGIEVLNSIMGHLNQ